MTRPTFGTCAVCERSAELHAPPGTAPRWCATCTDGALSALANLETRDREAAASLCRAGLDPNQPTRKER